MYRAIDQTDAIRLMNSNTNYFLLDVRTAEEYSTGHIPNAYNVDYTEIVDRQDELPQNKDTTIFVYCRSGARSAIACAELNKLGYTNVYNLGGMLGWTGEIEY